jgi:hypothetical protein
MATMITGAIQNESARERSSDDVEGAEAERAEARGRAFAVQAAVALALVVLSVRSSSRSFQRKGRRECPLDL